MGSDSQAGGVLACSVHSTAEQAPSEANMWFYGWQLDWVADTD